MPDIPYRETIPYYRPSLEQLKCLQDFAAGRVVADIGAGRFLAGTISLLSLGATQVHAVDRLPESELNVPVPSDATYPCFNLHHGYKAPPNCSRALLSWPVIDLGIPWDEILAPFDFVAYLGVNDGDFSCGNRKLWLHLGRRDLLVISEVPGNSHFMLYGPRVSVLKRPRCQDEKTARRSRY
jgi:hypothetical protein